MSDITIQNEPVRHSNHRTKADYPDEEGFSRAMEKASGMQEDNSEMDTFDNQSKDSDKPDSAHFMQEEKAYLDESTLLPVMQTGVLIQGVPVTEPNLIGVVNATASPVDMDQFSLLLEQVINNPSVDGRKWNFTLQNSSVLSQISLLHIAPGQWKLSLGATSQSEEKILTNRLDKLLRKLNGTGQNVDLVLMQRDKH